MAEYKSTTKQKKPKAASEPDSSDSESDREMTDESASVRDDEGSSADEESKTKSLQKMKATLPTTFEQK